MLAKSSSKLKPVHALAEDWAHVLLPQVEPGTFWCFDQLKSFFYIFDKKPEIPLLQVEPGTIWCFEQEQSLAGLNVTTTIRMTVVKLQNGELLVYAPIAPTR